MRKRKGWRVRSPLARERRVHIQIVALRTQSRARARARARRAHALLSRKAAIACHIAAVSATTSGSVEV